MFSTLSFDCTLYLFDIQPQTTFWSISTFYIILLMELRLRLIRSYMCVLSFASPIILDMTTKTLKQRPTPVHTHVVPSLYSLYCIWTYFTCEVFVIYITFPFMYPVTHITHSHSYWNWILSQILHDANTNIISCDCDALCRLTAEPKTSSPMLLIYCTTRTHIRTQNLPPENSPPSCYLALLSSAIKDRYWLCN